MKSLIQFQNSNYVGLFKNNAFQINFGVWEVPEINKYYVDDCDDNDYDCDYDDDDCDDVDYDNDYYDLFSSSKRI